MATVIQIKRSALDAGPAVDPAKEGEMAYAQDVANNAADAKLYIQSVDANGPTVHAVGGYHYTKQIDDATSAATPNTLVERDGTGAFAGDLTGNASTASAWATSRTITLQGDVTGTIQLDGSGDVTSSALSVTGAEATELAGDVKADDGTVVLQNGTDGTDATLIADILADDGTVVLSNGTDGTDATFAGNAATATLATDADGLSSAVTVGLSGDATGSATFQDAGDTATIAMTLDTVYSDAASVGSTTAVPVLSIDAKGRITGATTAPIATNLLIEDTAGNTDTVAGGETLKFSETNNETSVTVSNNEVTVGLAANPTIGGNLTVSGDLTVAGTTTTVDSTTVTLADSLLKYADANVGDAVDIGFFGETNSDSTSKFHGIFRDANDGKFHMFKDLEAAPTTTVDKSDSTYAVAALVANLEGDVTGDLTGNVTGDVTGDLTGDVYAPNGSKVLENGTDGTDASYTGSLTGGRVHGLSQVIDVADGGTGAATHTANAVLFGNGTGAIQSASGSNGDVMFLDPTTGVPTFGALDGGTF